MILTAAALLLALAANYFFQARVAMKRRSGKRFRLNLALGVVFLIGAGVVTRYGFLYPTAFYPRPDSNCTWGLGAAADGCPPVPGKQLN